MTGIGSKDELFDISDSTDWLGTPLAGLAPIDAALRCQVCKDFCQTPMITSCSHTFCSLCIRRCLANDGKCPACRASEQENKLRSNWAFEGLIDEFLRARSSLLAHARHQPNRVENSSPKRTLEEADLDSEGQDEPRKRTRSSHRLRAKSRERDLVTVLDDDANDDDYQPALADCLAICPVCSSRMKLDLVDAHLNICLNEFSHKELAGPKFTSSVNALIPNGTVEETASIKIERLPHLNYSLFKEAALRKKLQDLGLSGQGNRQLLERRHTEWVTLWNANCDASKPRKKIELLRELSIWEKSQGSRALSLSSGINAGSQLLHKDFDGTSWAAKHDQSFRDLIANARKNLEKKESKVEPTDIVDATLSMVGKPSGSLVYEGEKSQM